MLDTRLPHKPVGHPQTCGARCTTSGARHLPPTAWLQLSRPKYRKSLTQVGGVHRRGRLGAARLGVALPLKLGAHLLAF